MFALQTSFKPPLLYEILPLKPSLWFTSPTPHPSQSQSTVYTNSVRLGGGGGVSSPVGDQILQELNTLYLTRFRTCKIARQSQTTT
jgi:hypothetical protein